MRTLKLVSLAVVAVSVLACSDQTSTRNTLLDVVSQFESIAGNDEYINSPYVTAGDRVYMVGHQDGSFPDLGWHVTGEMGGIWDHPIKLMDGFQAQLILEDDSICLAGAVTFVNYPFANVHHYQAGSFEVKQLQFVPDGHEGLIVEYTIQNNGADADLGFVFTGLVDLMPVWLAEKKELVDGRDEARYNQEHESIVAKDQQNDWFVTFGSDQRPDYHGIGGNPCNATNQGKGVRGSLRHDIRVPANGIEVLRFYVAGSTEGLDQLWSNFDALKANPEGLLQEKISRYEHIQSNSSLSLADKGLEQTYRWIKYNTDWLIRDVPATGRALSAGIPDYPWWFGADNAYSIQGLLATGMHNEALSTIDLVMKLSREVNDSNGRIMHEASTNGVVFNPGNLNETPHFLYTLWRAYEWTGDQRIIDQYYEDVKKGIAWIESQDHDGNGYPDGPGMMEIHGLHSEMIDVVAYQAAAYWAAANFADATGDGQLAADYRSKQETLVEKINTEWWAEEFASFADFRASREQVIELIEAAIVRADTIDKPWSIEELEQTLAKVRSSGESTGTSGYVVHHNWVVNTPMEMGLAEQNKAHTALETARKYRNRFGMYVTGMDRDESQEKAEKWKAFSYVGAVMTLPTGVQAIAEMNYGNPNRALEYLKMLENSFSYALPGSMYEVSPDYGMIAQAWNIYAVAVPIVEHMFGVKPRAHLKKTILRPQMPDSWEEVSLSDVMVGDNRLTIEMKQQGASRVYDITQTAQDWTILFEAPEGSSLKVNGEDATGPVELTGTNHSIEVTL